MANKSKAKNTLVYYFKLLFEKAGVDFNSDIEEDIRGVIDDACLDMEGKIESLQKEISAIKLKLEVYERE